MKKPLVDILKVGLARNKLIEKPFRKNGKLMLL